MANGAFQPGTWTPLPENCTSGFWLTYIRCAEYGVILITECQQWVAQDSDRVHRVGMGNHQRSCSWWSWLFCVIWAVVVSLVCLVVV